MNELFRLSDPLDLYLVRHPKPEVDPGLCYGAVDLPVADDPVREARRLAPLLPARCRVVASALSRARLLAEALSPDPFIDERLRELDFGDWELKPFSDIPADGFAVWGSTLIDFQAPGGERYSDMADRVWQAFEHHRQGVQALVMVAHNGPMRALVGTLLGLPPSRWLNLEFEFGRLTRLTIGPLGPKLRAFNL
ncbi:histidine phosphatase family protein [Methyloversatilis thermotolerans]|uniref:histidine phosphatase family protein n=1 Tax=Methyloversatilis thermotolerans TaxID=1346290 RepID=UPI000380BA7E|nr:histidine phosphatase family protein [Methyloversatilis thermotolerans]